MSRLSIQFLQQLTVPIRSSGLWCTQVLGERFVASHTSLGTAPEDCLTAWSRAQHLSPPVQHFPIWHPHHNSTRNVRETKSLPLSSSSLLLHRRYATVSPKALAAAAKAAAAASPAFQSSSPSPPSSSLGATGVLDHLLHLTAAPQPEGTSHRLLSTPPTPLSTSLFLSLTDRPGSQEASTLLHLAHAHVPHRTLLHLTHLTSLLARLRSHSLHRYPIPTSTYPTSTTSTSSTTPSSLAPPSALPFPHPSSSPNAWPPSPKLPKSSSTSPFSLPPSPALSQAGSSSGTDVSTASSTPPTLASPHPVPYTLSAEEQAAAAAAAMEAEVEELLCAVESSAAAEHTAVLCDRVREAVERSAQMCVDFITIANSGSCASNSNSNRGGDDSSRSSSGSSGRSGDSGDDGSSISGSTSSRTGREEGGSPPGCDPAQLAVVEAVHMLRAQIETEALRLSSDLKMASEREGWWEHGHVVRCVDDVMNSHEHYVLTMRVLLSEVLCGWGRYRASHGLAGLGLRSEGNAGSTEEERRWSMAGPTGPPGHESKDAGPPSLILPDAQLVRLLELATEDTRAFSIEKYSVAPDVKVEGDEDCRPVIIDAYIQHIYSEVLKNGMSALIRKWGAWDVDEAEPLLISVQGPQALEGQSLQGASQASGTSTQHRFFSVSLTDAAGGMTQDQLQHSMHWFATTQKLRQSEGSWGYSRDHGAAFQGQGVGMPISRALAHFMGGSLEWETDRDVGTTTVTLTLPYAGFKF